MQVTLTPTSRLVVVARTREQMVRYVELPGVHNGVDVASGQPHVGAARYFFSYSWDSPWQEVRGSTKI